VAPCGDRAQVGALAYAAAVALRGDAAHEQVVLGDGAAWITTQADLPFPEAVGILDWAPVSRALHKALRAARPGRVYRAVRRELHRTLPAPLWHGDLHAPLWHGDLHAPLWHGDLHAPLMALRAVRPAAPAAPVMLLEQTVRYLQGQRAWMGDYAAWHEQGYPVGSGLIERAVALVITGRMKGRGIRWRRPNASAVVALRVRELNAGWDPDDDHSPLAA
jgi:hypothetical protein